MIRNSIFRANFSNVIFKNVDLTETYFNHTKFENVKFINCILNDELDLVIKKSIDKLKEPFKMAIVMREIQGLSYDEIARATNSSIGTVKSRIARARCKLQEYIKPYMC